MKHQHGRTLAAIAVLGLGGLLTACGSDASPGGTGDVTVTITPTVTAKPSSSSKPATPKVPASDVKGRDFDFGVVTKVSEVGGTAVLELDRWTWAKVDDAKLAKSGVPTAPFKGKVPYENQNAKITFTIPVADGARILYHHCIAADQPLQTKSVEAPALKGLANRENTVLVQLDTSGRATSIQNIPGCPG